MLKLGREEFHLRNAIVIYTHIVGIAIIRALGKMNVPVIAFHYSPNEMGHVSKYVRERVKIPDPRKSEQDFISTLIDLSSRFKGSLLIPTDDYTVVSLSKFKSVLGKHYVVGVEDWELVEKIIQKVFVYEFATNCGIPCPQNYIPKSASDLRENCRLIKYPCLIKPLEGHKFYDHYRLKMFKIKDEEELLRRYDEIEELGLKVMIQEIIPGDASQGVNYNSYFINGSPVAEFTARKVRIDPPFFGSPRVLVSQKIPEIIEPGRLLLRRLNYRGFSCMEFKRDIRDGVYKLMEINCRNNLTGALAVSCGINFPWIMYRHLLYGENNPQNKIKFPENIFWIDITKDILRFFASRKEEGYALRDYIRPYFKKKVFAILSLTDPIPFLRRCAYILEEIMNKVSDIIRLKFPRM